MAFDFNPGFSAFPQDILQIESAAACAKASELATETSVQV
jgi:hypothetical protein